MQKDFERKLARKIVRGVAKELRSRSFLLVRPTFIVRPTEHFAQFVHFHKFAFGPSFRMHLGIRVFNDPSASIALNGPMFETAGRFDEKEEETHQCVVRLIALVENEAFPWFARFAESRVLIDANDSPLRDDSRRGLLEDLEGRPNPSLVRQSKRLLKIADQMC